MHPWSYSAGAQLTVFYNSESGTYFELNHSYSTSFLFGSGAGAKTKSVGADLTWKFERLSQTGLQLLEKLKAKQGLETTPEYSMGAWRVHTEYSFTALSSSLNPNERIILTIDGFIYFGLKGALVLDRLSENYTCTARGNQLLARAISDSRSLQSKRNLDSLKVGNWQIRFWFFWSPWDKMSTGFSKLAGATWYERRT